MQFGQSCALFGLLLLPLALLFLFWAARMRRAAMARLGDLALIQSLIASLNRRARNAKSFLRILALGLVVFSLARPQWGTQVQAVEQKGVQVMFALDVSPSMLAQDVKPDRLTRAKLLMSELLDTLAGDEVGLVLFSGSSFLQFPLTTDSATAHALIEAASPETISRRGTAVREALETALRSFNARRASAKVLVIISDGEDHAGTSLESTRKAVDQDVLVYTIGVGSPQGAPIPLTDEVGQVSGFLKDRTGEVVISRLDGAFLRSLADAGGGRYYRAGALGAEVSALAAEIGTLKEAELDKRFSRQPQERFQVFLLAAVLCLTAAELIPERRRNAGGRGLRRSLPLSVLALACVFLLGGCAPSAASLNRDANRAYERQDYAAARRGYDAAGQAAPQAPEPAYNRASVSYREGDLEGAASTLMQALENAGQELAQAAYYNLGNVYYQSGEMEEAARAYMQALRLKPDDADAKHNLELALRGEQTAQQQSAGQGKEEQDARSRETPEARETRASAEDEEQESRTGGSPTPSAAQGGDGAPTGRPQATPSAQSAAPQQGEQDAAAPGATAAPQQGLTPEQAMQLLESAARDARSLQDFLRDQSGSQPQQMVENW